MTQIPLWLAILFPAGSLILGGFVAAWAVYTYTRNQNEKRDAAWNGRMEALGIRLETATTTLGREIQTARETADLKLSTAVEKESKSRHDAQNATANGLAALQQRFDSGVREMASRNEVHAIENRLVAGMGKLEAKMDTLGALVPEMNATLKALSIQVERLNGKFDGRRVPAE